MICIQPRSERYIQHQANVLDLISSQVFKDRYQIRELVVVSVAEPAADRHRVLRVEDVARWRIVDDDGLWKVSAEHAEVFDVVAHMVVTAFSE